MSNEPLTSDGALTADEEVVRRYYERVSELDVEGWIAMLTDDALYEWPYWAHGPAHALEGEELRSFIRALPKLFTRMKLYDLRFHGVTSHSGQLIVEARSDALTHRGVPYQNTYLSLFVIRDSKIALHREYLDPRVTYNAFARPDTAET